MTEPSIADVLAGTARYVLATGDSVEILPTLPEGSVDAIVCDPPYGLEFMGKNWDRLGDTRQPFRGEMSPTGTDPEARMPVRYGGYGVRAGATMEAWHLRWATEALRVLKPGGHLLAFGGTRTYHRLACAIEDAGFEVRDEIQWVYSTGWPKSTNLGGGLGTALKPSHEPIVVARKPIVGNVSENVLRYGVGALNIEVSRVNGDPWSRTTPTIIDMRGDAYGSASPKRIETGPREMPTGGRWPPNLVLTHSPECRPNGTREIEVSTFYPDYDWSAHRPTGSGVYGGGQGAHATAEYQGTGKRPGTETIPVWSCSPDCPVAELDRQSGLSTQYARTLHDRTEARGEGDYGLRGGDRTIPYTDSGGSSRFFPTFSWDVEEASFINEPKASRAEREVGLDPNDADLMVKHPTVKPIALMRWLVRLVTPPGGIVLDPFVGSGSTGCAAIPDGFRFIGIDSSAEYVGLARSRIAYWEGKSEKSLPSTELLDRKADTAVRSGIESLEEY